MEIGLGENGGSFGIFWRLFRDNVETEWRLFRHNVETEWRLFRDNVEAEWRLNGCIFP